MSDRSVSSSGIDLPFGAFERVVSAIVAQAGAKLSVHELSREGCVFMLKRGLGQLRIVVLRFVEGAAEHTQTQLKELFKTARDAPLDVVLIGGGPAAQHLLESARPFYTPRRIGLLHIADDLTCWHQKLIGVNGLLLPLDKKLAAAPPDFETWQQLLEQSHASRQELAQHAEELQAFSTTIGQRKPIATYSIAAVIGAVFALQLYVAGAQSTIGLVRMGALVPERVAAGEWWRLISCTFLHAGWMHVLLNTYVLLILGMFLERIIGPARFLIIYAASALTGSLGSYLFLKASFSVGASGAVWGLLGAHAILAFRSQGLLPTALIPGAQKAAMINLGINVLNSFRPHVDMWAHFAGGAAGALLFASGLLTRTIPRLGDLERSDVPVSQAEQRIPTSGALWLGGGLSSLLLVGGLAVALVAGRPFELRSGIPATRQRIEEVGVSLMLPTRRPPKVSTAPNGKEVVFGDLLTDPMVISVFTLQLPAPLDDAGLKREMRGLMRSLKAPKGTSEMGKPLTFRSSGDAGVTAIYRYPSGLILERAFLFRGTRVIRVEVLRWPARERIAPAGSARKIIESTQVL